VVIESYWDLVDPYWEKISIYHGPERLDSDLTKAPRHVQVLFCVHWHNSEVCNGGFDQFFFNSTGVLAPQAVAGYRVLGRPDLAEMLEYAMRLLGKQYPRDLDQRERKLRKWGVSKKLFKLDDKYFDVYEAQVHAGPLYECMDEFARREEAAYRA